MKKCPRCNMAIHLQATFCPQCGHNFTTQFPPGPTQQVPRQVPPAPTPPPQLKWWEFFNPAKSAQYQMERQKWQLENLTYLHQNGLITPEMKKRSLLFITILGVLFVAWMAWSFYESVQFNRRLDEDIHNTMTNNPYQPMP